MEARLAAVEAALEDERTRAERREQDSAEPRWRSRGG